jgi:hypothetical protein
MVTVRSASARIARRASAAWSAGTSWRSAGSISSAAGSVAAPRAITR